MFLPPRPQLVAVELPFELVAGLQSNLVAERGRNDGSVGGGDARERGHAVFNVWAVLKVWHALNGVAILNKSIC